MTGFVHKWIRSGAEGAFPRSVLLLVHGRTGNLKLMEWVSKRFKIDGLDYLLIQAPYSDRRPDQKDEGYSWYLEGYKGLDESRARLMALIEELEKKEGVSTDRIYWLGFSQGSAMGLDLWLRSDVKLGGLIGVSGFCIQSKDYPAAFGKCVHEQRILLTHGKRDEIISLEKAQESYRAIKEAGASFEVEVYDKPHSFDLKTEIPHLESVLKSWLS